jgi:hypothetical protein
MVYSPCDSQPIVAWLTARFYGGLPIVVNFPRIIQIENNSNK